ncbi:MAG: hypothetical protein ABIU77_21695 [Ferruginibacter sp.]
MRPLFTTIFLFYFLPGFSQDSTAKIFVKEVRWNIAIPENFDLVADSVQNKFNKSGAKLLGETNNVTVDVSQTKTLFSTHNENNYLYATITPFSEKTDGSYTESNTTVKKMLFKTFAEKIPAAQLDSSTSTITIDHLQFEKFTLRVSLNKRHILTMCLLYKLYKDYDFGIAYLYMNDWAQQAIEKVIFESTFSK